jgi:hypothetical protein
MPITPGNKPYFVSFVGMLAKFQKFGLRDLLWLVLVVSLWMGWTAERDQHHRELELRYALKFQSLTAEADKLREENSILEKSLLRFQDRIHPAPASDQTD